MLGLDVVTSRRVRIDYFLRSMQIEFVLIRARYAGGEQRGIVIHVRAAQCRVCLSLIVGAYKNARQSARR